MAKKYDGTWQVRVWVSAGVPARLRLRRLSVSGEEVEEKRVDPGTLNQVSGMAHGYSQIFRL